MVHIYKNKGGAHECENYRPICLAQIIYKIRPGPIARKLIRLLHLLTGTTQYEYKQVLCALGAIVKNRTIHPRWSKRKPNTPNGHIESFWHNQQNAIMDNLVQERITPRNYHPHKEKGHQETRLCVKHKGEYGEECQNNVGVFQGSAISALMFIIYLDDTMEDFKAMNRKMKLTTRQQILRDPTAGAAELIDRIEEKRKTKRKYKNNTARA